MTGPLVADLVLEGGGVLGIGHVGALSVLEDAGYSFARVAGSSVGAIVGSFVAAGLPAARMHELMDDLDWRRFQDRSLLDRVPIAGPLLSLVLDNGVFEGDYAREWIGEVLAGQGVRTFADLRRPDPGGTLPPDQQYKLVVTAVDVTRGQLVRLPWDYERVYGLDPDTQLVADAVRASMSIPFFFEPVSLMGKDGTSTLVDGGMLSNYPIDLFDRTDGARPRWPTFGVKLFPRLPAGAAKVVPIAGLLHHGPVGLLSDLLQTILVGRDQTELDKPWVTARTMIVESGGINPVDFGIKRAQVDDLYAHGREAAEAFLAGWSWQDYLRRFRPATRPGRVRTQ